MYVYLPMSSKELVNRLNGIETSHAVIKGGNTFKCKDGIDYIHFYKFAKHAFINKKPFGCLVGNNELFGCVVAKVKLDDDIIPPLEYGFYNGVETSNDDSLFYYSFPIPEIIIDRKLFSNECIVGFSDTLTGEFERDEDGIYPLSFWNQKNVPFKGTEMQLWGTHDIYYEYIKSLFRLYNNDHYAVAKYLKTIDLDKELAVMAEKIKKKKLVIKKKVR